MLLLLLLMMMMTFQLMLRLCCMYVYCIGSSNRISYKFHCHVVWKLNISIGDRVVWSCDYWRNDLVHKYRTWSRNQQNWVVNDYYICGQLLFHLWPVITFVANCYYICDQLLHLWPVITFVASTVPKRVKQQNINWAIMHFSMLVDVWASASTLEIWKTKTVWLLCQVKEES